MVKTLAAVTAVFLATSAALAAPPQRCATPEDISAVQAIAVQEQMMVAGQSCDAWQQYTAFISAYRTELFAADRQLGKFFRKMNPRTGERDYDQFKTDIANLSSQFSFKDIAAFCANSKAAMALAVGPNRPELAVFVSAQPVIESNTYQTCQFAVAGGMVPHAPRDVPIPIMKPGDDQLPPLGSAVAGVVTAPIRAVTGVIGGIFSHLPPFNSSDSSTSNTSGSHH